MNKFFRTKLLLGEGNLDILKSSHVMVFGVGGVGGYVVEALVRSGVAKISIIDNDTISETNINRQIIATTKNVGSLKVEEFKHRINEINPQCEVKTYPIFIDKTNIDEVDFDGVDYIVDAVDTITAKLEIISKAKNLNIKIISSMGAGNRLDFSQIKIADLNQTKNCPLAKVLRYELRKLGIVHVKCIYSTEIPLEPVEKIINEENNKQIIGSISYMPSIFGLMIAGEVIKDLTKKD